MEKFLDKFLVNYKLRFIFASFARLLTVVYCIVVGPIWVVFAICFYAYFVIMHLFIPLIWIIGGRRAVLMYKSLFLCYKTYEEYHDNKKGNFNHLKKLLSTHSPDAIDGDYEYDFIFEWFAIGYFWLKDLAHNAYEQKVEKDAIEREKAHKKAEADSLQDKITKSILYANSEVKCKRDEKLAQYKTEKKFDYNDYYAYVKLITERFLLDPDIQLYIANTPYTTLKKVLHPDIYDEILQHYKCSSYFNN